MAEQTGQKKTQFEQSCQCGSSKTHGEYCGAGDPCECASGKAFRDCCGAKQPKRAK